ncbi:MAG: hypothetical protein ACR2J9_05200 [Gaiellales bacterium]
MTRTLGILVALLVLAAPAQASVASAGAYLAISLDRNGCAHEPGGTPTVNLSAWVAFGLVAAGRSASGPAACIEKHATSLRVLTDVEVATLALVAAGRNPRSAGGRDFVQTITSAVRGGRIGTLVATNQFGILALKAAGAPIPASAKRTLLADQNADGSWPVSPGGDGDSNLTATGIQAAIATGIARTDPVITRALSALKRFRSRGGYALSVGSAPDAQSTAWVLSGLSSAGRSDAAARAYLGGLQAANGSFAYQRGTMITPVWVTAQATMGLAGRSFPLVAGARRLP